MAYGIYNTIKLLFTLILTVNINAGTITMNILSFIVAIALIVFGSIMLVNKKAINYSIALLALFAVLALFISIKYATSGYLYFMGMIETLLRVCICYAMVAFLAAYIVFSKTKPESIPARNVVVNLGDSSVYGQQSNIAKPQSTSAEVKQKEIDISNKKGE